MCRLLALSAHEPVALRYYLDGLPHGLLGMSLHGAKAPHRDGMGWVYRDERDRMRLHRWGAAALSDDGRIPEGGKAATTLFVAHARKASPEYGAARGALQAQPMVRDGVFLAHNGTIRDVHGLGAGLGTDSQRLVDWLAGCWRPRTPECVQGVLADLPGLVHDYTAINLLFTEGTFLYALCLYTRDADYYTLHRWEGDGVVVVASEPVDDRPGWRAFQNGELLVVRRDLSTDAVQAVPPPA